MTIRKSLRDAAVNATFVGPVECYLLYAFCTPFDQFTEALLNTSLQSRVFMLFVAEAL